MSNLAAAAALLALTPAAIAQIAPMTQDTNADGLVGSDEFDTGVTDDGIYGFLNAQQDNPAFFDQSEADGSGDTDETERSLTARGMEDRGLVGDFQTEA